MPFAIRKQQQDRFLEVAGARLRYRDEGRGHPIVFVHGWALNLEMWTPQVELMQDQWRIIRMDRRGFGASRGTPSLADDVRDLVALFDHLRLDRAALVGMSQGARVVMRAVPQLESRLACLVLDGAPLDHAFTEQDVPIERYRHLVATNAISTFRSEWLRHPLMQLHDKRSAAGPLLERMLASYKATDLKIPASQDVATDCHAVAPADIKIPTLVVNGEFDEERRRVGDILFSALPDARRAIIPGAGHLPNLDRPREYDGALRPFIEQHCSAAP
jgi:3-oxoadipate enol-lactonase